MIYYEAKGNQIMSTKRPTAQMKGILIGNRTGQLIEEWRGTLDELSERFFYEGRGYHLEVSTLDGEFVCEWFYPGE